LRLLSRSFATFFFDLSLSKTKSQRREDAVSLLPLEPARGMRPLPPPVVVSVCSVLFSHLPPCSRVHQSPLSAFRFLMWSPLARLHLLPSSTLAYHLGGATALAHRATLWAVRSIGSCVVYLGVAVSRVAVDHYTRSGTGDPVFAD
jgi:hypothetical protein